MVNVHAQYIQKKTINVVRSQTPHFGTPYAFVLFNIVAIDSQGVAKNSDSVSWVREPSKVPGNMMKRLMIPVVISTKRTKSNMKTISPMTVRPLNLCGV